MFVRPSSGLALALGVWVWASAEMAAWLAGGHGLHVSSRRSVPVVGPPARPPRDPRQAWPASARAALPGPALFYLCATLVLIVGAGGWRRSGGRSDRSCPRTEAPPRPRRGRSGAGRRGGQAHGARRASGARWAGGARWAVGRDLRASAGRPGRPIARLVLGRTPQARRVLRGGLLATEARHSVLVVGPTQSGKTSGLAVPALLEWRGPVIATSVKDDLAATSLGWRSRHGPCWVFDPTRTSGLRPLAGWTPLAGCADWSAAQRMASWLVEATPARAGMADAAFWYAAAAKQLAPLLLAAHGRP